MQLKKVHFSPTNSLRKHSFINPSFSEADIAEMNPHQSYSRGRKSKVDVRIPICSAVSSFEKSQKMLLSLSNEPSKIRFSRADSVAHRMNKFAQGIREHVKLGNKITETVKGKLSLGKKILQVGGVSKIFKWNFNAKEGEELLKTCQCYLSTTSGPIAGLLFISTDKVAFCSERSIKLSSSNGKSLRVRYKVMIPLRKITSANESRNVKKPSQKYIQVVTEDKHEFWFMGFLNHQRTLKHLKEAIYQTQYQHVLSYTTSNVVNNL